LCPAFAGHAERNRLQFELNGLPHIPDVDETPYGIGEDTPGVNSIPADGIREIYYASIRIEPDKWIKPEASALIDGAGGIKLPPIDHLYAEQALPGNFRMKRCRDHDGIVECDDTMQLVVTLLALRQQHENK
jgi:hypothetical protein